MRTIKENPLFLILFICLFVAGIFLQRSIDKSIAIAEEIKASSIQVQNNNSSFPVSAYPVICQFKTRNKFILISAGPDCPLYSLKSSSGQVFAVDLHADKFISLFPELTDIIKQGIANWAGLDIRYQKQSCKSAYDIRTY